MLGTDDDCTQIGERRNLELQRGRRVITYVAGMKCKVRPNGIRDTVELRLSGGAAGSGRDVQSLVSVTEYSPRPKMGARWLLWGGDANPDHV